jgi:hypothetical protein
MMNAQAWCTLIVAFFGMWSACAQTWRAYIAHCERRDRKARLKRDGKPFMDRSTD